MFLCNFQDHLSLSLWYSQRNKDVNQHTLDKPMDIVMKWESCSDIIIPSGQSIIL